MQTQDDADGRWMVLPTPEMAAAHATPFPDFDRGGKWKVRAAVHDFAVAQMVRIAERESER